jgi:hypothetical protein
MPHAWIVPIEKPDGEPKKVHINQIKRFFGQIGPQLTEKPEEISGNIRQHEKEILENGNLTVEPRHKYNLRPRERELPFAHK